MSVCVCPCLGLGLADPWPLWDKVMEGEVTLILIFPCLMLMPLPGMLVLVGSRASGRMFWHSGVVDTVWVGRSSGQVQTQFDPSCPCRLSRLLAPCADGPADLGRVCTC